METTVRILLRLLGCCAVAAMVYFVSWLLNKEFTLKDTLELLLILIAIDVVFFAGRKLYAIIKNSY